MLESSFLAVAAAALALATGNAFAQDSTAADLTAVAQPAPQLTYGETQVLQLAQAKVSDGVIVNYIHNSGATYNLNANGILYLKQKGVSDTVLNAMLAQRNQPTASAQPSAATSTAASSDQSYAVTAPATTTYVQSVPSSTVYVIPDTQTYRYDAWFYGGYPYGYYPDYGYYGYYGYPSVSLSFGFGNRWGGFHDRGFHGGWHGGVGGFRGGGFHGGGFHGRGGFHR